MKKLFFRLLDAKPCRIIWKLPQKLCFGAKIGPKLWLRSCPDLLLTPKIKNTQGKIYGTYLGKIYMEYNKECIGNIHWYLWYEIIRNIGAAFGGAQMGRPPSAAAPFKLGLCFWLFYIINIYGYSVYIPYIFHIYFLDMFHIFSLVS